MLGYGRRRQGADGGGRGEPGGEITYKATAEGFPRRRIEDESRRVGSCHFELVGGPQDLGSRGGGRADDEADRIDVPGQGQGISHLANGWGVYHNFVEPFCGVLQ